MPAAFRGLFTSVVVKCQAAGPAARKRGGELAGVRRPASINRTTHRDEQPGGTGVASCWADYQNFFFNWQVLGEMCTYAKKQTSKKKNIEKSSHSSRTP